MEVDIDSGCNSPANNFTLINSSLYGGKVPVQIYTCPENGLHLALVKTSSKTVNVDITLATEPGHGDGVALATAKMALLGNPLTSAVNYLAQTAAHCFCTDIEDIVSVGQTHTSFTFKSLSDSAFFHFLTTLYSSLLTAPLTTTNFLNEIYKVSEFAHESGCLYEEALCNDTKLDKLVDEKVTKLLFNNATMFKETPKASCSSLRAFLSLEDIKAFHQKYYRPSNMFITVVGNINDYDIPLFNNLGYYMDASPIERPFYNLEIPASICHFQNLTKVVGLSATGESVVSIGFLGGNARDLGSLMAAELFVNYLNTLSVFKDHYVPELASHCEAKLTVLPRWHITVRFEGVRSENTDKIAQDLLFLFRGLLVYEGEIIQQCIQQSLQKLETGIINNNFHQDLFERMRQFQQFSLSLEDSFALKRILNPQKFYHYYKGNIPLFKDFVQRYLVDECVVVVGLPSNANDKRQDPCFQDHVKMSCEMEKLANQQELFQAAKEAEEDLLENQTKTDDGNLTQVITFPTDLPFKCPKIHFFDSMAKKLPGEMEKWKSFLNFDRMPTVFHEISDSTSGLETFFTISLSKLSLDSMRLLPLFIELIDYCGIAEQRERKIARKVMEEKLQELQQWSIQINEGSVLVLNFKPKNNNLNAVAKWFTRALVHSAIGQREVKKCLNILLYKTVSPKNEISKLAKTAIDCCHVDAESATRNTDMISLERFYANLQNEFTERPEETLERLETLRKDLINCNVNLHIIGAVKEVQFDEKLDFTAYFKRKSSEDAGVLFTALPLATKFHWNLTSETKVLSLDNLPPRSSLIERVHYKTERFSDVHAAILTLCEYMTMAGGVLWTTCVKTSRARVINMEYFVDKQMIELRMRDCYELREAREAVSDLVKWVCEGKMFDPTLFEASKKAAATKILQKYYEKYNEELIHNFLRGIKEHEVIGFVAKVVSLDWSKTVRSGLQPMYKVVMADNLRVVICAEWNLSNEDWTSRGTFRTSVSKLELPQLLCS
ncbi:unnamed protein product [Bursaphelenchus okinawaensis]|uniref:Peptidase M16 C-terminal domain-containing protein n=1 Tax=Bursaphelenchus okinawaensis TaxID=465554 RepID=A0A811JQ35_9BILA|nr:unnamed protein product [Bursaphelenchus okinawaensis]CAG9076874.1 unnamed protein product [Bursaphelenchus okinawaensis]